MTSRQTMYAVACYEGLIRKLELEQTRLIHGEESQAFAQANAQFQANLALAVDSVREVANPDSRATWQGWVDGVQRYAAIGGWHLPRELTEDDEFVAGFQRSVEKLIWDELNGWMPHYYDDLPTVIEMIRLGVTEMSPHASMIDTFMFFKSLAADLDHTSGNFGDGFSDDDRKRINEAVKGDLIAAAELVHTVITGPEPLA